MESSGGETFSNCLLHALAIALSSQKGGRFLVAGKGSCRFHFPHLHFIDELGGFERSLEYWGTSALTKATRFCHRTIGENHSRMVGVISHVNKHLFFRRYCTNYGPIKSLLMLGMLLSRLWFTSGGLGVLVSWNLVKLNYCQLTRISTKRHIYGRIQEVRSIWLTNFYGSPFVLLGWGYSRIGKVNLIDCAWICASGSTFFLAVLC